MFDLPLIEMSTKIRSGLPLMWSEFVATFGLLFVVLIGTRRRSDAVPYAVAAYITAAYWFTASTSFANPVVTLARGLTDTFTGIHLASIPGFLIGQASGATAACLLALKLKQAPTPC